MVPSVYQQNENRAGLERPNDVVFSNDEDDVHRRLWRGVHRLDPAIRPRCRSPARRRSRRETERLIRGAGRSTSAASSDPAHRQVVLPRSGDVAKRLRTRGFRPRREPPQTDRRERSSGQAAAAGRRASVDRARLLRKLGKADYDAPDREMPRGELLGTLWLGPRPGAILILLHVAAPARASRRARPACGDPRTVAEAIALHRGLLLTLTRRCSARSEGTRTKHARVRGGGVLEPDDRAVRGELLERWLSKACCRAGCTVPGPRCARDAALARMLAPTMPISAGRPVPRSARSSGAWRRSLAALSAATRSARRPARAARSTSGRGAGAGGVSRCQVPQPLGESPHRAEPVGVVKSNLQNPKRRDTVERRCGASGAGAGRREHDVDRCRRHMHSRTTTHARGDGGGRRGGADRSRAFWIGRAAHRC